MEPARRKKMLLLGAIDMDHVLAAAAAFQREQQSATPEAQLLRALETAVVVCSWRPFSANTAGRLVETDAADPELHREMKTLRNQAHAHIDKASGRTAGVTPLGTMMGVSGFAFTESWWSSVEDLLPRIIEAATRQRDAFRAEAMTIPEAAE